MKRALDKMRSQVQSLAGKYADPKRRKELDQVFDVLAKELESQQIQSQRIMVLLRAVIAAQPGSAKAVNEFLRSPNVAQAMHASSGYNLD